MPDSNHPEWAQLGDMNLVMLQRLHSCYSAFMTLGSANVLSFQHMQENPTNFHQLTHAFSHVCNKKTTTLSKYKRHTVSLVYRTITHTACRFLHTPQKRQKNIYLYIM
ncbi:hypothetical protein Hanom_Chr17g01553601 [Helianthus anomalus]